MIAIWAGYKLCPKKWFSKKTRDQQGGARANERAGGGDERGGKQKASTERNTEGEKWSKSNKIKFGFYVLGLVAPTVLLSLWVTDDFPQAFLFTCISESVLVISWKVIKKKCLNCSENRCCNCCGNTNFFQVIYVVVSLGVLIAALTFFIGFPTTDEYSRAVS